MTIQDAYTAWAATYDADRNRTRDLDAAITQRVLADVRADCLLEIGCGTGKNTPFLAEIALRVLALDFSPGMLAVAQARRRDAGIHNVAFARADLTDPWPCPAGWADLVACNLVLEHIRDLDAIYAEARRVLRPGGRLFVCELHPYRQYAGKRATFRQGGTQVEIPAFVHHLSDFLTAAEANALAMFSLKEWWDEDAEDEPPRLVSLLYIRT